MTAGALQQVAWALWRVLRLAKERSRPPPALAWSLQPSQALEQSSALAWRPTRALELELVSALASRPTRALERVSAQVPALAAQG